MRRIGCVRGALLWRHKRIDQQRAADADRGRRRKRAERAGAEQRRTGPQGKGIDRNQGDNANDLLDPVIAAAER